MIYPKLMKLMGFLPFFAFLPAFVTLTRFSLIISNFVSLLNCLGAFSMPLSNFVACLTGRERKLIGGYFGLTC
jgi:hypothetical protein